MRHMDDIRWYIWYIKLTCDCFLENFTESLGVIWWGIAAGKVVINSVFRRVGMFLFWLPQVHLFHRNLQETLQIVPLLPLLKTKSTYNIAFKNIPAVWAVEQDVRTDKQIDSCDYNLTKVQRTYYVTSTFCSYLYRHNCFYRLFRCAYCWHF